MSFHRESYPTTGSSHKNAENQSARTAPVWLADSLEKLPAWSNNRIDELLPFAPEAIGASLVKVYE